MTQTWDKPPPAIVRDKMSPEDRAYYQQRANPAIYRPSPAANAAVAKSAARLPPRPAPPPRAAPPPPPPPPPPRPWREAEQQRLDRERRDAGSANMLLAADKGGAWSNQLPPPPPSPFDANVALAREKANQNPEKVKRASGYHQVTSKNYERDPDSGGYKRLSAEQYKDFRKKNPDKDLAMKDVQDDDGGVWVYLTGNTSLTGDNLNASQSDVWAQMTPGKDGERAQYIQARLALRNLKPNAPGRWDIAKKANDLAVTAQYRSLLSQFEADPQGKDIKGGFFTGKQLGYTGSNTPWDFVPGFIIWQEMLEDGSLGMKSIESLEDAYDAVRGDAMTDPYAAGELIVAMLNGNFISGAQTQYADQYVGLDENNIPIAQWNHDYDQSLRNMVQDVAESQAAQTVPGQTTPGFWEELRRRGQMNQDALTTAESGPPVGDGGGGGFGFGGFGGGGGGFADRVFLTDPTAIGSMVDSIARARLGRVLNSDEKAAFIDYYHNLERQYSAAYVGGGEATQPNLEGQAVAWIESRYLGEQASESAGEFISALAAFIRGSGLGSGGSS